MTGRSYWREAVREGTDAPASAEDGRRWAGLIESAADILARRGAAGFRPLWDAPAAREAATSALELSSDRARAWGELPYRQVWVAHSVLSTTLIEHARAMALLLASNPQLINPLEAQARVMVEIAAQACWLTWPGIGGRARVARLQVLRRASTQQRDRLVSQLSVPPGRASEQSGEEGAEEINQAGDPVAPELDGPGGDANGAARPQESREAEAETTIAMVEADVATLGLSLDYGRRGGWTGVAGEVHQKPTERARWYFGVLAKEDPALFYPYLCGATHGELWRLTQGFQATGRGEHGVELWTPWPARVFTRLAVMIAVEALVYTARYAFTLLGSGAGIAELRAFRSIAVDELTYRGL